MKWRVGVLFLAGFVVTLVCLLSSDEWIELGTIALYVLLCMGLVRFDPVHPVSWLLPFLYVYHFSFIILGLLGLRLVAMAGPVLMIGWISICAASLVCVLGCRQQQTDKAKTREGLPTPRIVLILWLVAFALLSALHDVSFVNSGFSSKATANVGSRILQLSFVHKWLLAAFVMWLARTLVRRQRFPLGIFISVCLLCLTSTLVLGERDIILAFIVSSGLVVYYYYHPKKLLVYTLAIGVVLAIPFLNAVKNIFASRTIGLPRVNVVLAVLSDEFVSTGRNLDTLLSAQHMWRFFYGETVIWDVCRIVVPGVIRSVQSPVGWFNDTFHPDAVARGMGYGFAFSGEGFVNFGYVGVAVWSTAMGLVVAKLYNASRRSTMGLVVYALSTPYFVYAIRGDLANLFSPILKNVLLPLGLMSISGSFFRASTKRQLGSSGRRATPSTDRQTCHLQAEGCYTSSPGVSDKR